MQLLEHERAASNLSSCQKHFEESGELDEVDIIL